MSRGQLPRHPAYFPRMKYRAFGRIEDAKTDRLIRAAFAQLGDYLAEKYPVDVDAMWEEFKQRVGWDEVDDDEK